jgi:hypothetical protein
MRFFLCTFPPVETWIGLLALRIIAVVAEYMRFDKPKQLVSSPTLGPAVLVRGMEQRADRLCHKRIPPQTPTASFPFIATRVCLSDARRDVTLGVVVESRGQSGRKRILRKLDVDRGER